MSNSNTEQRKLAAIMFTDMVGSTQLKQELGDRDALALIQRHHGVVRELLRQFSQGHEISTAGDSFFLVFDNPSDAVKFALLLQARLRPVASQTARAVFDRIGIHVGEVFIEAGEGLAKPKDLHGIQVDTCSRVMALAQGNQILMTRLVFDNARQVLKGQDLEGVGPLAWLNHGPYLLKGVEEPLEVCEVGEAGKGALTPPANSEKARRRVTDDSEPVLGWRPALEQVVPNTRWMLERKLGEGGFGEVWLGRHETLKERRVFKFCFRADRVRSLKREVTLFRVLKERVGHHPNIVGIQEVFFDTPPFYIVMDYAEATDLRAWCEREGFGNIPMATRLEIVAQVADALQAAHEAGVIHRDVKPSNILVSNQKSEIRNQKLEAKLTDFGIGQVVSEEALAGLTNMGFTQTMMSPGSSSHTGTQLFMAPELLAGKPASTRSDIYSLGVVLYQLLIGDFSRPLTTDWARAITDPLLREDLQKCFAGNPEERFASAGELARNLREIEQRQTELAASEKAAQRLKLFKKAAVAVSTLVVLGALLMVALKFMSPPKATVSPAPKTTIAVIPFRNDSSDPSDEYLSDSLTTEIINGIRKAPGLNAVRPPALPTEAMRTVFAQVAWPFFFEGSIQKNAGRIKIFGRLVATADGSELWATNYERAPGNLLGIPNDMALRVAELSGVPMTVEARERIQKLPTQNAEAYDYDLRGRLYIGNTANRAKFEAKKPIEALQRAVQLDPAFAVAYADLARAYVRRYFTFHSEDAPLLEPKALAAMTRAFQLDPDLAEANFAAGYYYWTPSQHWQHGKAIQAHRLVLEKNPYGEEANVELTIIYLHIGLLEEARHLATEVFLKNPLDRNIQSFQANILFWEGKDAAAAEIWRKMAGEVNFNFVHRSYFAVALINLGKTNEVAGVIEAALKADPQDTGGLFASVQAILLAKAGDAAAATNRIAQALGLAKGFGHSHHTGYNIAATYALLNQPVEAIKYLRAAAEDGFPCYPFFKVDRNLDKIRPHPEFLKFMKEQAAQHDRFVAQFGTQPPPAARR